MNNQFYITVNKKKYMFTAHALERLRERYTATIKGNTFNIHLKFLLQEAVKVKFNEDVHKKLLEKHHRTNVDYLYANSYILVCDRNVIITIFDQGNWKMGKNMFKVENNEHTKIN